MVRGSLGLVNLWETRVEAVLLAWPTIFPISIYTEYMPKPDTICLKFPGIYLIYMYTLSGAFGFKAKQSPP